MTATKILKSLLIAALLSCASAHADEASQVIVDDGQTAASFKVSEVRCQVVEGQIRCTFG
jgi:hypothetical protein